MSQHGFHPQLLVRARKSTDLNRSNNIFEQQYGDEGNQPFPALSDGLRSRRYSLVGDRGFVDKFLEKLSIEKGNTTVNMNHESVSRQTNQLPPANSQDLQSQIMNSTFAQSMRNQKLLSRLSRHQQLNVTRDKRNLDLLKAHQKYWQKAENLSAQLHNRSKSTGYRTDVKSAMETSTNKTRIYVMPNPSHQSLVVNNPNGYWKKSLRNHDPELMKYIEGVPVDKIQLQKLLQTAQGTKKLVQKVPELDLNVVKKAQEMGGLVLSARSKFKSQIEANRTGSVIRTEKYPVHLEQVFKANWEKRDIARKGMTILPKIPYD